MIGSNPRVDERSANRSSWHFLVSETQRHVRGHTLYKVTLQIIPVDISAAVQEIIWWKRYTEFHTVHKVLSQLHTALFLKGTFPVFPKPTVFHRLEEPVIEARRQAAEKLLNFIAGFPILCRHDAFRDFLKDGEEITHAIGDFDTTEPLRPQRLYALTPGPSGSVDDESLSDDISLDSNLSPRLLSPISGIWRHRCSDAEDDPTAAAPPVPPRTMPPRRPCWTPPSPPPNPCPPSSSCPPGPSMTCCRRRPETTPTMPPLRPTPAAYVATLLQAEGGRETATPPGEAEDYLFIAGHHLARANDKELAGDFEVAFGLYKLGIDILLRGVQTDEDPVRRDAVRRKAGKYLSKAEQLYNEYISTEVSHNVEPLIHSEYSSAAASRAQLAQFTVIGVVDAGVVLVMHRTTRDNFVIKTLRKSPGVLARKRDQRTIIPLGGHKHMVQLHYFVETDDAVHLVLERAPGGKLWNYIAHRMSVAEDSPKPRLPTSDSVSSNLSTTSSDGSTSFAKLMHSIDAAAPPPAGGSSSEYAALFYKFVPDADAQQRSRTSSLAFLERSTSADAPETLDSGDMLPDWADTSEPINRVHPDALYLQDMEPLASPTLRGLENWRDVGEIDSQQLIAKSKELLLSVDKVISIPEVQRAVTPVAPVTLPEPEGADSVPGTDETLLEDTVIEEEAPTMSGDLRKVPEALVRRWMAEIVLGVEALHELGIVCGDLHWDNILLGDKGRIKLTYFSQWSSVIKEDDYACLTDNAHIPPELRRGRRDVMDPVADSWSIGVLLFELLTGQRFSEINVPTPNAHRSFRIPADLSAEAQDLLRKLLKYSPRERLTLMETKEHPFFRSLEWRRLQP
ncbi:ribosomal protein S6 kinase delta-1-like [Paramacrobiotus metropolitanus]|uniref:ribosomal protein S6 kinase delta-1-like n=1 Tax=Paramacrobiotus metropolitanus TaxID=2943436 RepID=UPI002445C19C|nr:ribosomal protein S6 kinase delta-1-like [Paramacrobiotus metropolitanus]